MNLTLLLIIVLIIVGVVLVIASRVTPRPAEPRGVARAPAGGGHRGARVEQLRRSLMTKAMGDASKVDALVDYERRKDPSMSEEECYIRANERWERDNR